MVVHGHPGLQVFAHHLKVGKDIGGIGEVSYGFSTNSGYASQLQITGGLFFRI